MKEKKPSDIPPILYCIGKEDTLTPHDWAVKTNEKLKQFNIHTDFSEYSDLDHEIGTNELNDVRKWILKILPPPKR